MIIVYWPAKTARQLRRPCKSLLTRCRSVAGTQTAGWWFRAAGKALKSLSPLFYKFYCLIVQNISTVEHMTNRSNTVNRLQFTFTAPIALCKLFLLSKCWRNICCHPSLDYSWLKTTRQYLSVCIGITRVLFVCVCMYALCVCVLLLGDCVFV